MSRNYDRKVFDKENSFDTSFILDRPPKQPCTSNGELRRKFDQNLALLERDQPNTIEDDDNMRHIKRDNARRRGFDMKVTNIDTINDKISGLLSMVKKDRQREKNDENFHEVPERQFKDNTRNQSIGLLDRIKKMNGSSKPNKLDSYSPRPERSISPFGEISAKDHKRGYSHLDDMKNEDTEPVEKMKKLKLKYLDEEMSKDKQFNWDGVMKERNVNVTGWRNKEK